MSERELPRRFEELFSAYVDRPREEYLAHIAELGEELVRSGVPPEDIAEIFEEALRKLSEHAPDVTLRESVDRISIPLVEMLIAYGLAFREQLSRRQAYEKTRLAAQVIENVYEGIWVTDRNGGILITNPALLRITGYTADEAAGRGLSLICGQESNGALMKKIWTNVRETGYWRGELTVRRKSGERFPALLTISSIKDDDGSAVNYVGVLDDITEQKRHEEIRTLELARAKQIYDLVIRPKLQVIEGAGINVECLPAENIGGDILQITKIDEKKFLVFLADVTGHGVPAAMTANSIKMLVREISLADIDPGAVCNRLNKAVCGNILPDDIVAGFCGLFDLETMTLAYCLAGLPSPVIASGDNEIHLKPTGPPLGVFDDADYRSTTVPLKAGDLFLAFTDGITEARDGNGTIFGNSGVQSSVAGKGLDAHTAPRELLSDVVRFQQSSFFSDDVILLAIEIFAATGEPLGSATGSWRSWSRFSMDAKCILAARTKDIQPDSMVEMVMENILSKCCLTSEEFGKIKVALFEILSNAIEHGNLQMTGFKRDPDLYDTEEYRTIFRNRLSDPEYGERLVIVESLVEDNEVRITVKDEGNGFDVRTVADPTRQENLENYTGRGIRIAEMAVDKIAYDLKGNKVVITKKISERFQLLRDTDN